MKDLEYWVGVLENQEREVDFIMNHLLDREKEKDLAGWKQYDEIVQMTPEQADAIFEFMETNMAKKKTKAKADDVTITEKPAVDYSKVKPEDKPMAGGLWRDNPATPEGKYLVVRRDGSIPEWMHFVLGAKDPAAPAALRAYADRARELGMDAAYCDGVRKLADDFDQFRQANGEGDPERGKHRVDDPKILELMKKGKSA